MDIYEYVFGKPIGSYGKEKVLCPFHIESNPSANISDTGQFYCYGCKTGAHDETTFIKKYFNLETMKEASKIKWNLNRIEPKYIPKTGDVTVEQRQYLNSIGIKDFVIDKYFKNKLADNTLISVHEWNGSYLGYTLFNSPKLKAYKADTEKYKYSAGTIAGMCTPMDILDVQGSIAICEGEKDAYTLLSMGHKGSIGKLGGAGSPIIPIETFKSKSIAIIYDCDDAGRNGAIEDAIILTKIGCKVRVIDLGLQDKEDLNDYFIKYNHTLQDLYTLINNTQVFVIPQDRLDTPVDKLYKEALHLKRSDLTELINRLTTYLTSLVPTGDLDEDNDDNTSTSSDIYLER